MAREANGLGDFHLTWTWERVGYAAVGWAPGSEVWADAVLWGLALGLSASGLSSGAKAAVK